MLIRPMTADDVVLAEQISNESFHDLDRRTDPRDLPVTPPRPPHRSAQWVERTRGFLRTDAGGCWVAEVDGEVIGFATALARETMWCLATFAVRPHVQGRGVGRPLLDAALQHGRHCLRGMLSASVDQRALRRYHAAGFDLHPQMYLHGVPDRHAIPVVEKVREGSAGDTDLLDSVDRRTRGAGHGVDHAFLQATGRLLVSDTTTGSGYAYLTPDGSPSLLAATNRRTATRLLWAAVAACPTGESMSIDHVTGANAWAVDVGLAARLELRSRGFLGLRGMSPPAPYLHHGALL